jgi:hypothetical protein
MFHGYGFNWLMKDNGFKGCLVLFRLKIYADIPNKFEIEIPNSKIQKKLSLQLL